MWNISTFYKLSLLNVCHRFFNSDSYKKLPQDIKDYLGVLVQKYNEYSPNWK